jgi:hypothetical protein
MKAPRACSAFASAEELAAEGVLASTFFACAFLVLARGRVSRRGGTS